MALDTFLAQSDDQYLTRTGATYPPTGGTLGRFSTQTVLDLRRSGGADYRIYVALLRFDTSSIPDSNVVSAATLRLYVNTLINANSLSLQGGWYAWDGTSASDWTNTPETNALSGAPLSGITNNADNDFSLLNADAFVSKTGSTYLRLHVSQRASDAAPTGDNRLQFAATEDTVNAEARLIVTHNVPPSVSNLMVGGVGV